jgi:predicted alpha/beta hydrolase
MREWCYAVQNGRYQIKNTDIKYENTLVNYKGNIASISYENDEMAPKSAVQGLLLKMPKAKLLTHHILEGNHFSWVKNGDETISTLFP